jgi:DHA2 family multidrug resistance protein
VSFGIALETTMSERRQSFHQSVTGANLTHTSTGLRSALQQTADYLQAHGFSHADAANAALARYYAQLGAQTKLLGFMDCFYLLAIMTFCAVPLLFLTKHFKVGGKAPAGH